MAVCTDNITFARFDQRINQAGSRCDGEALLSTDVVELKWSVMGIVTTILAALFKLDIPEVILLQRVPSTS